MYFKCYTLLVLNTLSVFNTLILSIHCIHTNTLRHIVFTLTLSNVSISDIYSNELFSDLIVCYSEINEVSFSLHQNSIYFVFMSADKTSLWKNNKQSLSTRQINGSYIKTSKTYKWSMQFSLQVLKVPAFLF